MNDAPETPGASTPAETVEVEVAYAKPEVQRILSLLVPVGTSAVEAVRLSGITDEFPEIDPATAPLGIFGKAISGREQVLQERDRVEIYRPLLNDPKVQRAERARAQKAQNAQSTQKNQQAQRPARKAQKQQ